MSCKKGPEDSGPFLRLILRELDFLDPDLLSVLQRACEEVLQNRYVLLRARVRRLPVLRVQLDQSWYSMVTVTG